MKRIIFLSLIAIFFLHTSDYAFELIPGVGKNPETTFEWAPIAFPIKYGIQTNGTGDVPGTNERNQLKLAMNRWNPMSPFKFQFSGLVNSVDGGDLKNAIIFDNQSFQAGSSVLAVTEAFFFTNAPQVRVEGDIHFNDRDFKWTTGKTNSGADTYKILPVAVHELGHSVGLTHSAIFNATMFFASQGDDRAETLDPDDVAGVRFLYGPRQNDLPVPRLISPLDNTVHRVLVGTGTQAASGITFRWEQNTTLSLTNFSLQFAANPQFTQNLKKYNAAAKLAFFMGPGAKLNALKNIQKASSTGRVYWRVQANSGGTTVSSGVQSIQLEQQ
jgi:Matrixin